MALVAMGEKVTKGRVGEFDVDAVPHDEIHGHVQGILHIVTEVNVGGEGEEEQATTGRVGACPDMCAKALVSVALAVAQR